MVAEVFLAAVAKPDAEDLRDLLSLVRGEALVEGEGTVPFASAGLVFVRVPMATGQADASAGFLDELQAGEIGVVLFVLLGGHGTSRGEHVGYQGSSAGAHRRGLLRVPVAPESKRLLQSMISGKQPERFGPWQTDGARTNFGHRLHWCLP